MNKFSVKEQRKYMFYKHIKNHLFEYIFDFFGPILLTALLLYLCKAEEYLYGLVLSSVYSLGRITYSIIHYKKEYIDVDIK